jgi:acylphosphatase
MSSIFKDFFNSGRENKNPSEIEYRNDKPENTETIKIKAQVYGVVQGVGFRYTTKHLADQLGVNGIVRNENDGSVYVEALASENQIEQFIEELAKGPSPSAVVDKVVIEYDDSITDYEGFGERH